MRGGYFVILNIFGFSSIILVLQYAARLFPFSEKKYPESDKIVIPIAHGF